MTPLFPIAPHAIKLQNPSRQIHPHPPHPTNISLFPLKYLTREHHKPSFRFVVKIAPSNMPELNI
jgi:hypothetical protein